MRNVLSTIRSGVNGLLSYLLIHLTLVVAFVLFRLLNRTRVYGREHLGSDTNTLVLSNHRTIIDSYLLGQLTAWPWGFFLPRVLPWHPAAKENFFRGRVLSWFSRRWQCIPVRRGERDFEALGEMTERLSEGQMIIFPEGTRSRTGELLPGRPGTGKLIHDTGCKCVPIYVSGMEEVLPVGRKWPRLFRRIDVSIGAPVPMGDLLARPSGRETSTLVIGRVMEHIAGQKRELEEIQAARTGILALAARGARHVASYPAAVVRRLVR